MHDGTQGVDEDEPGLAQPRRAVLRKRHDGVLSREREVSVGGGDDRVRRGAGAPAHVAGFGEGRRRSVLTGA